MFFFVIFIITQEVHNKGIKNYNTIMVGLNDIDH